MKGAIVILLAAISVSGVLGGRIYDEKQDSIDGVKKRFSEVDEKKNNIIKFIHDGKKFEEFEKSALTNAEKNRERTKSEFNENKIKTVKSAIAKGKPASAIDCISRVILEGEKIIPETYSNFEKILAKFKENKLEDFGFAQMEIELILSGLEALKKDSLKAIEDAKAGFQNLKNDFVKKADAADKQMSEIDKRISQINLKEDYKILEGQNTNKNKEIADVLSKKFLKCVS